MRAATIPVPPLDEQRRIVDILEDHLSRLDAARNYLRTAESRANALEQSALSRCRDGNLVGLDTVAEIQGGIQKQQKRKPNENAFPFLRVANVTARGLDLADVHSVELFDGELERLRLTVGDLLVVEGNGSPSQIGRAAMWNGSIQNCVHQNHLIRVRPGRDILPGYLEAVWNSPQNRALLTRVSSSSSGLHTLSVTKLKALTIPLPAVDRQRDLVNELSATRAARQQVVEHVRRTANRASALRRAVLTAAFTGKLTEKADDVDRAEEMATT